MARLLWNSMPRNPFHRFSAVALLASASLCLRAEGPSPLRSDADLLKQKVATITQRGAAPSRQPLRTTVTEREVNAYLVYEMADELPAGVADPSVSIPGTDRVTARAVVDLDAVRRQRNPTSLFDPMRYLRGRLPVRATGVLHASNGIAQFELESADIAGVPIPKLLLQEIVSHYSRSAEHPSGINLDDPVALPARIREIHVERGQAVIVQ
jgi:hypothetical protein